VKATDGIVACGGWFKREVRFKLLYLVAGAAALVSAIFTGVVGSITVYILFHDRVRPESFLLNATGVGAVVTLILVALTVFIGKREKERQITVTTRNPHCDPKCLY
jgi:hypothetical protein